MKKDFKNKAIFGVFHVSFQRQKLEIKWMNLDSYFANLIKMNLKRPCSGLIMCVCDIAIAMKNECSYKKTIIVIHC